jgi:hypothetical protein
MAASSGGAIVLRPFAERAVEMLPLHLPFGFELPVEQAHYLLTPTGRSGLRPETLLFRDWLLAEAARPSGHGVRRNRQLSGSE